MSNPHKTDHDEPTSSLNQNDIDIYGADHDNLFDLDEFKGILQYVDRSQHLSKDGLNKDMSSSTDYAFNRTELMDISDIEKKMTITAVGILVDGSFEELPSHISVPTDNISETINSESAMAPFQESDSVPFQETNDNNVIKECEPSKKQELMNLKLQTMQLLEEKKDQDQTIRNLNVIIRNHLQKEKEFEDVIMTLETSCKILQDKNRLFKDQVTQKQIQAMELQNDEMEQLQKQVQELSIQLNNTTSQFLEYQSLKAKEIEAKTLEIQKLTKLLDEATLNQFSNKLATSGESRYNQDYRAKKREELRSLIKSNRHQREKLMGNPSMMNLYYDDNVRTLEFKCSDLEKKNNILSLQLKQYKDQREQLYSFMEKLRLDYDRKSIQE